MYLYARFVTRATRSFWPIPLAHWMFYSSSFLRSSLKHIISVQTQLHLEASGIASMVEVLDHVRNVKHGIVENQSKVQAAEAALRICQQFRMQ